MSLQMLRVWIGRHDHLRVGNGKALPKSSSFTSFLMCFMFLPLPMVFSLNFIFPFLHYGSCHQENSTSLAEWLWPLQALLCTSSVPSSPSVHVSEYVGSICWHCRLCHPHERVLRQILSSNNLRCSSCLSTRKVGVVCLYL